MLNSSWLLLTCFIGVQAMTAKKTQWYLAVGERYLLPCDPQVTSDELQSQIGVTVWKTLLVNFYCV